MAVDWLKSWREGSNTNQLTDSAINQIEENTNHVADRQNLAERLATAAIELLLL